MCAISNPDLLTHVVAFGAACLGALLGSLSAFYLGRYQQKRDEQERRHGALLSAQYALISQWTALESIRRDHLEPHRSDETRFTKLTVYYSPGPAASVPFRDITFIANTEDADLLQQVHIAELRYLGCIEALKLRNARLEDFYKNPIVKHSNFDFKTGQGIVEADSREVFFLKQLTDELYKSIDSALPKLLTEAEALGKFIKLHFPGRKALKMVDIKPEGNG